MRSHALTILLLTLLAAVFTLTSPEASPANWGGNKANSDWGKAACIKRAPNVQRAIEMFCRPRNKNGGFMVPGAATTGPSQYGNARVGINGGCNPVQWLPWDICFKQFYCMCVSGNGRGENSRVYGNNRCHIWKISSPK